MKVLIAVDGSKYSDLAVKHCVDCQWGKGTEFKVISVADLNALFLSESDTEELKKQVQKTVDNHVKELKDKWKNAKVEGQVLTGLAKQQILNECNKWKPDLIVMGTHGRTAIGRLLLGSVSQTVLNHCPCSIRIVREETDNSKVLIAVDSSECSQIAVNRVLSYKWLANTKFLVCSVIPDYAGQLAVDPYGGFGTYLPELNTQAQKNAEELTAKIEEQLKEKLDNPVIEKCMPMGDAREEIIKTAEEKNCSMIFLGSHNLGLLDRVIIGSVSEAVAVHAPCTIEIVRSARNASGSSQEAVPAASSKNS